MDNFRSIILLLFAVLSTACNAEFITDNLTDAKAKFGYYSKYTGFINEANIPNSDDLKTMAKEIQPVINYANAITLNTVYAFTPDVLSDNASILYGIDRQDNSTCEPIDNSTYRRYLQFYKGKVIFQEEYIDYRNFCYMNSRVPLKTNTTSGRPLTRTVVDNNSIIYYMLFDNLTTTVVDDVNGFSGSYTMFGILDRVRSYLGSSSRYRLGLDYTVNGGVNRFDITFDDSMRTRELKYYSSKYGYITVSLNTLTSKVTNDTVITYKYAGGSCQFWVNEIDKPIEFQKYCPKK